MAARLERVARIDMAGPRPRSGVVRAQDSATRMHELGLGAMLGRGVLPFDHLL